MKLSPIELELLAAQPFHRKQCAPGVGLERLFCNIRCFAASAPMTPSNYRHYRSAVVLGIPQAAKPLTQACEQVTKIRIGKSPVQKRRRSNWTVKRDLASENDHFHARSPKSEAEKLRTMLQLTVPTASLKWVLLGGSGQFFWFTTP